MQSFIEFLQDKGKLNASEAEKEVLKKEHQRLYFKHKRALKKQTHRRIELWYLKTEFAELEREPDYLEIRPTELLKAYIRGYRENRHVRTKDSKIRELVIALNRWGSNLNQIAYKSNGIENLSDTDVQELKSLFYRIRDKIDSELEYVPLEQFIMDEYKKNPRFLEYLIEIVEMIKRQETCS